MLYRKRPHDETHNEQCGCEQAWVVPVEPDYEAAHEKNLDWQAGLADTKAIVDAALKGNQ